LFGLSDGGVKLRAIVHVQTRRKIVGRPPSFLFSLLNFWIFLNFDFRSSDNAMWDVPEASHSRTDSPCLFLLFFSFFLSVCLLLLLFV
jgi:hypothetical protein